MFFVHFLSVKIFFRDDTVVSKNFGKGSSPTCRSFNQRLAEYYSSKKKPDEYDDTFDDEDDEYALACIESRNQKRPDRSPDSTDSPKEKLAKKFAPDTEDLDDEEFSDRE